MWWEEMSSGVQGEVCNQALLLCLHWSDSCWHLSETRNQNLSRGHRSSVLRTVGLPQSDTGQWDNSSAYHKQLISSICKTSVIFSSISYLFKSIRTQSGFNAASQSPPILREHVNPFSALPQISDGNLGRNKEIRCVVKIRTVELGCVSTWDFGWLLYFIPYFAEEQTISRSTVIV